MPKIYKIRRKSLVLVIPLTLLLALTVAGCGSSATGTSGVAGNVTPSPTLTKGGDSTQGCPDNVTLNPAPDAPTLTITQGESQTPVTVHQGQILEIQLPVSQRWTGPTTSQGNLELQTPYGYVSEARTMCVWRFIARSKGTTNLNFDAHPICLKGQMCPQFILTLPFMIVVK